MIHFTSAPVQKQYQTLKTEWDDCQRCSLSQYRHSVVHYRGNLPCHMLLIGEAPGRSEDLLGEPFVGPAGQLLGRLLQDSEHFLQKDNPTQTLPPLGFANLLACLPRYTQEDHSSLSAPQEREVHACRPRLETLFQLANPKAVILLGKVIDRICHRLRLGHYTFPKFL